MGMLEAVFEDGRARWIIALGAGALSAAGFAPVGVAPFVPVGLCLLAMLVCATRSMGRAFFAGYLWGFAYFAFGLRWVLPAMQTHGGVPVALAWAGLFALAGVLALFPAVASWFIRFFPVSVGVRMSMVFPAVLTLFELLRGEWLCSFGWLSPGYAFADNLLGAWAPIAGVYGVGFGIALLAGAVPVALASGFARWERLLAVTLIGAVALGAYGLEDMAWSRPGKTFEVRLVQPALPVTIRPTGKTQLTALERVGAMSLRTPMSGRLHWIVWPESVYMTSLERLPLSESTRAASVSKRMDASVVFNAFSEPKTGDFYNSILCAENGSQRRLYAKRHRVPFGEYVPYGFRWLVDALSIPMVDQCAGETPAKAIPINGIRAGLGICYENLFTTEVADWFKGDAKRSPEVLLFVANLGWFDDAAARQFTQISQMRARETARPVLQAVNNAHSAYIDARGNIERLARIGGENLDVTARRFQGEATPAARFGLWPVSGLVLFMLLVAFLLPTRSRSRLFS